MKVLVNSRTLCDVSLFLFFSLKVRVLEGVEQVYVHYKGGKKEDDGCVELTPERV